MKNISDYIEEHLKIEINNTSLLLEKYGLFDGCKDIVSKCVNDIKRQFRDHKYSFTLNYTAIDFSGIHNVFFENFILNVIYNPDFSSGGEYIGIEDNLNKDKTKLKNVKIDISFSYKDWLSLSTVLTHELTHAYEDYNRCKKNNVKTLKDIEDLTYTNAISNIETWGDDITNIRKAISFFIYLSNKSELNAFIVSFSEEINKLDIKFNLTNEDVVKSALSIIRNTSCYKKYAELNGFIDNLDEFDKESVENEYNDITNSNKTYSQIKKEMKSKWYTIMNKLNSTIPKIICDYMNKHTIEKKIEKKISKKI